MRSFIDKSGAIVATIGTYVNGFSYTAVFQAKDEADFLEQAKKAGLKEVSPEEAEKINAARRAEIDKLVEEARAKAQERAANEAAAAKELAAQQEARIAALEAAVLSGKK